MRILIADDEELTRNGIASSITWSDLHITVIDTADDGVNALSCAKTHTPDILLTDVRMPRMDGIELSRQIRELNPDCAIIFMSGYSDKEYLKAAINLKAVSYVEKPFASGELTDALSEAVSLVQQQKLQQESQRFFIQEAGSRLALALTQPLDPAQLDAAACKLYQELPAKLYFTTIILQIHGLLQTMSDDTVAIFTDRLQQCVHAHNMDELHTLKHSDYLILHIFSKIKPAEQALTTLCEDIRTLLQSTCSCDDDNKFYIILGDTVCNLSQCYESYNSAALLLQSAFFYNFGHILTPYDSGTDVSASYLQQLSEQFHSVLSAKKQTETIQLCHDCYQNLLHNRTLLPGTVKELYYHLFSHCISLRSEWQLISDASNSQNLLDNINCCLNLNELHQMLTCYIDDLFSRLQNQEQESSTVYLIKNYINTHYSNDVLSIKDISDHVHLSSSYVCTVFKTETGQTLNQYLTNLRIEKAKQLLVDPRNKINEISLQVGYSDCNYFGKTFKKVVGVSPSEYREKELS